LKKTDRNTNVLFQFSSYYNFLVSIETNILIDKNIRVFNLTAYHRRSYRPIHVQVEYVCYAKNEFWV